MTERKNPGSARYSVYPPTPEFDRLEYARQILRTEANALQEVADRLGDTFLQAVDLIFTCPGRVCVTGTGKSADVGQKISGTLNSTGTRAYVLDVTRAVHGDLGMVAPQDVVLALSHSGESEELLRLLPSLKQLALGIIAITSNGQSSLARLADIAIVLGPIQEACPLGLAPSTSTTVMLALGDALAFVLSRMRNFGQDDFARFHPAGSLGRRLMKVEQIMRRGEQLRLARASDTVRQVFASCARKGRRTGAVILLDDTGKLAGIFTDSDLARLFEQKRDEALDRPISEVMTRQPITVPIGTRVWDAVQIMSQHRISELPVVDAEGRPLGLLDITDVLNWMPTESTALQATLSQAA
ncbi:MAG: KpsF/GutQ family sugar-phosphate isomerase [Gemmatales bacterium]|nr:KpsF/GutQ family sugar-phosphate isomerase [Gemmatales bacterium]MDW7995414.1 KpsF/GutQ family sugar-phosphate isomerase [Gemmatales bacterium]